MHIDVNNLPKVVTQLCPEKDLNPRPVDRKSNASCATSVFEGTNKLCLVCQ